MALTFASLHLYTDRDDDVFDLVAGEEAFVSPPMLGWVSVYDREADEGNLSRLADLAIRICGPLECAALAFLVLDDVMFYLLFDRGDLIDEYASDPDFFGDVSDDERAALRGKPRQLLAFAAPGTKADQLAQTLADDTLSGRERCARIAARLGIQNATLGFRDLLAKLDGADVEVVGWERFLQSPPPDDDDDLDAPALRNGVFDPDDH